MSIKNYSEKQSNLYSRKANLKLLLQLRFTFDTERDLQGIVDLLADKETLQEILDILQ